MPSVASRLAFRARRFRRYLPLPLVLIVLIVLQPLSWGAEFFDDLTNGVGVVLCALGQGLRLWAWGSNFAMGKSHVRDCGPYALMRHPLYTGNFFILLGVTVIFNNPWAYPLVLLPFAYLYHLITAEDEKRMSARCGANYQAYAEKSPSRFLPSLGNLATALRTPLPFGWKLAGRKEYESCCAWLAGAATFVVYKGALTYGWEQTWVRNQKWLLLMVLCGSLPLALRMRKYLAG